MATPSRLKLSWSSSEFQWTSTMEPPETFVTPTTALRSRTKIGGLFDTGVTGVSDGKVTSVKSDSAIGAENQMNLTDNEVEDNLFSDLGKDLTTEDLMELTEGLETGNMIELNEDSAQFCEVFTNLSDFLLGGNVGDPTSSEEITPFTTTTPLPAANTAEGKKPAKRTAAQALLADIESGLAVSPVDHNDYTLKSPGIKRSRLSTTTSSVDESDAESTISSTTKSSTEKHVERRIKNNIASCRSRKTRKQKFVGMEEEAVRLEKRNKELEQQVAELEALTKKMKAELIAKLAGR